MKKVDALQKIFQLSEYVKLSVKENSIKNHHRLKTDLSKSSKRILFLLTKGPLNQRAIASNLNISPQAISEAVKKLEVEDLVIKEKLTKNETIIKLSPKGIEHSNHLHTIITEHSNSLLKNFSDDDLSYLIDMINKIINQEEN